jgi:hypothetical protein
VTARRVVGVLRLLAALTGVVAIVARFHYGLGFSVFIASNFFGYLTVQANLLAVATGLITGVIALRRDRDPNWMPGLRIATTSYMVVAGIIFAMLASQAASRGYRLDVPWSDQVLHFVLPVWFLLDWLLAPGARRNDPRILLVVVGYPLAWGLVTLIRGRIVGWYPYFFLDPDVVSVIELLGYGAAALGFFALVGSALLLAPHHQEHRAAAVTWWRRLIRSAASGSPAPQ